MTKKQLLSISVLSIAIIPTTFLFSGHIMSLKNLRIFQKISAQAIIFPQEITHGNISKKEVIFTFDTGSTNESGDKILEVLAKHHVKGTFFLTGKMLENNLDFIKRVAVAGHEIFNHTYDHTDLTTLSDNKIGEELTKVENLLQVAVGTSPKPYFRAPYGARDARVLTTATKYGYQSVRWTVDALDWKDKKGEKASQVKKIILSSLAPGNIYLMHVGDITTGAILDDVFTSIESKGYRIVSLTQGL
jgi:peptidoglycan/xylan/chitin deacetylase (PgdA/CDA1 family)